MITDDDMRPVSPRPSSATPPSNYVVTGVPIPKQARVTMFSANEWEEFVEEWCGSLDDSYHLIRRHSGAGDMGIDVAGYLSDAGLNGEWDNYQCKHYDKPLSPSMMWVEFGKVIYYSFKNEYTPPRKYYFVAPRAVGTALSKLMDKPEELKSKLCEQWDAKCKNTITKTASTPLTGELLEWFEHFDFSIFAYKSVRELIEGHKQTPFHTVRFGGGLDPRPAPTLPPDEHAEQESRYIRKIFDAYSDHLGTTVDTVADISSSAPHLKGHLLRQRTNFFSAESLRNFARDNVPEGTFDRLQDEVFHGVIDICESNHDDGLERMREVVKQAAQISLTANPLRTVVQTQDRQGICHQLANDDRLAWVPNNTGEE